MHIAFASHVGVAAMLLAAVLSGCIGHDHGAGMVSFYVKDAPSDDFDSVFIVIQTVEVHLAGHDDEEGGNESMENETHDPDVMPSPSANDEMMEHGEAGWTMIVDDEAKIDLKAFAGDARALLGNQTIEAGKYTQIRMHVTEVYGMKGGNRTPITLPGAHLKIVRPWTVEAGGVTQLTVDFDLEQSIQAMGNGEYKLKPTLKLAVVNSKAGDDEAKDKA